MKAIKQSKQMLIVLFFLSISLNLYAQEAIRLTNGEWPPYLSKDLKHYGVASRIVTEAFALEGIKVEYGFFPWERALELAKQGDWDGSLVWFHTPEREKHFYYSDPVIYSTHVFFHLKSYKFDWNTIEGLQGVTIGGSLGSYHENLFRKAEKSGKIRVEWVSRDEISFRKLLKGRIDIFSDDIDVGYLMLRKNFTPEEVQLVTYHPKPVLEGSGHLLLSKKVEKNRHLIVVFNKGLKRLRKSGKLDQYLAESRRGEYIKR